MTSNTLKTITGFLGTMISKYTPVDLSNHSLEGIYNYLLINNTIATSGQPTEEQFSLIKEAGYQTVINLAPNNAENSLADEAALLNSLNLKYIHIPVDFKNPTSDDFTEFVTAMNKTSTDKTWVHCAANMRVSSFIYKYRCQVLNENKESARSDLEKIWEPLGVWKKFVT